MHVHVEGGTNAGTRAPFEGAASLWECDCFDHDGSQSYRLNPGYLVRCPECGTRRP